MNNSYQKYISTLKKYPEEVGYYFSTDLNGKNNKDIVAKYKISDNFLYDLVFDIVGNDFNFSNLENAINNESKIEKSKTKELSLDIIGMLFLPLDTFLEKVDIKNELIKRGGLLEDYKKFSDQYLELLQEEYENAIKNLAERYDELVDYKEEESVALDLISNNLVNILKEGTPEALSVLNGGLISLLNNVETFKNKILKTLSNNQEKISSRKITVRQKEIAPTISGWINDFISQKGVGDISQIDLSDYLINSQNVKNLNNDEKQLIIKLLNFYRNLKLYPYSLSEMPENAWEVIPVGSAGAKKTSFLKKTSSRTLPKPQSVDSISSVKKTNATRLPRVDELRAMADKYPVGSLERKAIEEEIKRIERGN